LQIESEDALLGFLLELGREYWDLLGMIRSEYLSVSGMDRLLNAISAEDINESLWSSLRHRLRLSVDRDSSTKVGRFHRPWFEYDSSRPFDGIISHLTRECGGNVHTCGLVSITASGNHSNQCHQVVDYNWGQYWISSEVQNSWIQFDFKNRQISMTNYTIRSDRNTAHHLMQWSVAGSNDEKSWTILDQRNTQDLNGANIVKSFACESVHSSTSSFRFVRLTQTGPSSHNYNYLQLSNLEFFGRIVE
jgi:hypothetical protein